MLSRNLQNLTNYPTEFSQLKNYQNDNANTKNKWKKY